MFLKNCWYLAAWSEEVTADGMLGRTIAGEPVLMLRDPDGMIHALADSCPHRLVPLSRGSCANGAVTCGYHGLRFASDGRCIENPHGPISKALSVPAFACIERHAALWVWLGEGKADPDAIPDYSFIDRTPPASRVKGYLFSDADYRLMVDNIMDLTHADFLHASTLGGGINSRAKTEVKQADDTVAVLWSAIDDDLPPLMAQLIGAADGRGDFHNRVLWEAPGHLRQQVRFSLPNQLGNQAMDSMTCHVMTPETATTTHYFFCHTSDMVTANPAAAPQMLDALMGAFAGEDKPMLEAQSKRIGGKDFWSFKPALLPSDKGAVLVRRTLDRLIEAN